MQTLGPEQIAALDNQLGQTETVKKHNSDINDLKENDEEIIKDLEGLKDGQHNINVRLEKGDNRMDGIEQMIRDGDNRRDEQHNEVIKKIDDKEMKELRDELRLRKDVSGKVIVGLIVLAAGTLVTYIAWSFGKISGVQ